MMQRSRFTLIFGIVAGVLLLALFGYGAWRFGVLRPVAAAVSRVSNSVYGGVSGARQYVHRLSGVDYARCVEERDTFARDAAELRSLRAENQALKAALDYQDLHKVTLTTARVIGSFQEGTARLLTLDRGARDGILPGQPVAVLDGILIGKVSEVHPYSSTVMLLSDGRSKTSVVIGEVGAADVASTQATEVPGVLEGDRGITIAVSLIPQDVKINPGSAVVTAGLDPFVPRGLLIGHVSRVEKDEGQAFQRAIIDPPEVSRYPVYVSVFTAVTQ